MLAWAEQIAALAPLTLRYNKLALNAVTELAAADDQLDRAEAACWASADAQESLRARAEGVPPEFRGN